MKEERWVISITEARRRRKIGRKGKRRRRRRKRRRRKRKRKRRRKRERRRRRIRRRRKKKGSLPLSPFYPLHTLHSSMSFADCDIFQETKRDKERTQREGKKTSDWFHFSFHSLCVVFICSYFFCHLSSSISHVCWTILQIKTSFYSSSFFFRFIIAAHYGPEQPDFPAFTVPRAQESVSERASEQTNERRLEQANEKAMREKQTSEWPSTHIWILGSSGPLRSVYFLPLNSGEGKSWI